MLGERAISSAPPPGVDWWRRFEMLLSLHLPDLTGKSVLDVDVSDGYFSFAAERLGASRVVALNAHIGHHPADGSRFDEVRRDLASRVESIEIDMLDISPDTIGKFDVVLFLGSLYHNRHPLLTLERIESVTNELLVVETLTDMAFSDLLLRRSMHQRRSTRRPIGGVRIAQRSWACFIRWGSSASWRFR